MKEFSNYAKQIHLKIQIKKVIMPYINIYNMSSCMSVLHDGWNCFTLSGVQQFRCSRCSFLAKVDVN